MKIWRTRSDPPSETWRPMVDVAPRSRYRARVFMLCLPAEMQARAEVANSLAGVFSTWQPYVCNDLPRGAFSVG
ncbi:Uncharacterised protein [Mycobacteroides abscessus subsp. abscessus]|nr:Uncharacterised protein [Mycobacteroides abscessus subsp. abscessus]